MNNNQSVIVHSLFLEEETYQQNISLEDTIYSIGRSPNNSIILNSQSVSRHHATLIRQNYTEHQFYYVLIDGDLQGKRSQNGISVNGQKVIRHQLKHGDTINFGKKNIRGIYQIQEIPNQNLNSNNSISNESENLINSHQVNSKLLREQLQNTLIISEKNLDNTFQEYDSNRLSSFPELCPNPIIEIDHHGNVTYSNPAAQLNFENLSLLNLDHPLLSGLITNQEDLYGKVLTREITVENQIFEQYIHYLSEHNLIRIYIFDITKRKQSEEMLRYQSLHDSLTGLPNRDFFYQELNLLLQNHHHQEIAILFIDIDHFKKINDTLNHNIGDVLLQQITYRLLDCLDENIFISRWGGDEFTLILSDPNSIKNIEDLAQNIKNNLKKPFQITNHTLYISASIGISFYPKDAQNEDNLIKSADAALYRAKELGRNNYQFYLSNINREASYLFQLENSLHKALENNQFSIFYQPQINITNGTIHGFEALIRWHHPEFGQVSPAKFIPLAEDTGLIINIGEWVIETVCYQNKIWQNAGLPSIKTAVNLSALQFQQDNFTQMIIDILEKTQLDSQFLELEITEGVLMQDVQSANLIINSLLDQGVTFSLDDFGTGYSSLGYLKKFPFHTIKIDRSFIQDLNNNKRDWALISAVITIANGFDMIVIGEGVETKNQLDLLMNLGCQIIQGRLYSYPLKAEDIPPFLEKNNLIKKN